MGTKVGSGGKRSEEFLSALDDFADSAYRLSLVWHRSIKADAEQAEAHGYPCAFGNFDEVVAAIDSWADVECANAGFKDVHQLSRALRDLRSQRDRALRNMAEPSWQLARKRVSA